MSAILELFRGGAQELVNVAQTGEVVGNSTSVRALGAAVSGNAGYFASVEPEASMFINARSRFLEAGLISCASCIHNFVMTLIYGVAALIQMGQNAHMNTLAKRSMVDMTVALIATGIGAVGAISPEYGARATAGLVNWIFDARAEITAFLA